MKFEFAEYHRHATDDELLDDIKRVANSLQRKHLSMKEYDKMVNLVTMLLLTDLEVGTMPW